MLHGLARAAFRHSLHPPQPGIDRVYSLVSRNGGIAPAAGSRWKGESLETHKMDLQTLYPPGRFNQEDVEDGALPGDRETETEPAKPIVVGGRTDNLRSNIKRAKFIKSSVSLEQCPPTRLPEFAIIGRSNVGKSSLINMLTRQNALAAVSKTPGKTRTINHFLINESWYLVDLPGYGYAQTSKENVKIWNAFTREYFVGRETLVAVLLLVDASIPPRDIDVQAAAWFDEAEIPYVVVFTKLDKRKKGTPPATENVASFLSFLQDSLLPGAALPPTISTSSKKGQGREQLLSYMAQMRRAFETMPGE